MLISKIFKAVQGNIMNEESDFLLFRVFFYILIFYSFFDESKKPNVKKKNVRNIYKKKLAHELTIRTEQ